MKKSFLKSVCKIAVPVTLQSIFQSSFGVVDQIMIGQLGSESVAGVGLAGKFTSIFSVIVSAIAAVAGIMIAQYVGQKNRKEVSRSFFVNLFFAVLFAIIFTVLSLLLPNQIMGIYTQDSAACNIASDYLSVVAWTYLPQAGAVLFAALLRCIERAAFPLYASISAALLNTGLNYIFIFGKFGVAPMGARGAAIATVVSQAVNFAIMLILFLCCCRKQSETAGYERKKFNWKQYAVMLLPVLTCEFMWSLGENVYAGIYGHLGTQACAAMTLINPIQSLMIGALCGLSQAAGVIIGKLLGSKDFSAAYTASKKLMIYGFCGSAFLSILLLIVKSFYVNIYQVEQPVKLLTEQILIAYAIVAPFKIQNMILGGGILRSGGKTNYVMCIDLLGTWVFGVPLGLISAFVFELTIPYVYFILSLEECVRFGVSLIVFRRKRWMQQLKAANQS